MLDDAADVLANIGRSRHKLDGWELVEGRATFVADLVRPEVHHLALVRSPHPRARILEYRTGPALALDGVVLVMTGPDAAREAGTIPYFIDPEARGGRRADQRCLALGTARYVGEPVAAVVATDRSTADRAAALMEIDYEPLPAVLDAETALAADAPVVFDGWDDNVILARQVRNGDPEAAIAAAPHVLEERISIHRFTTVPIEPRGYLVECDVAGERLTIHASCQNPNAMRWQIAGALGMDEDDIHVITQKVGGSFGLKMQGHAEETLIALCARRAGVPVMWLETREETFLAGAREQIHDVRVGFDDGGRLLGLVDHIVADVGAASAQPGWAMANNSAQTIPTGYDLQDVSVHLQTVVTNKSPWNAARGFGKEGANFLMERVMDHIAGQLGLDPLDVRRINLIAADRFPYRTASGLNIDSGDYHGLIDLLTAEVGYDVFRTEQQAARAAGRYLGIGLGFELTPESADGPGTLVGGYDTTTVRLRPSGRVQVLTGVTAPGGGNETGIAQVVADEIGARFEDVDVVQGDTERCPYGFGNFSGRGMLVGGGSAALAARDLRAKLELVGARMLGIPGDGARAVEGHVVDRRNGSRSVAFRDVIHAVVTRAFEVADDIEPTLESTRSYKPDNIDHHPDEKGRLQPYPTYSNGICAVVVEVDPQTGLIDLRSVVLSHDCGVLINPALVEGQARGAVAMGLGGAWTEDLPFRPDGQPIVDRFKTYLLLRAEDLPPIRIVHQVTPSPFTLLGTKGAGEAGVGSAMSALTSAVEDALAPFGVRIQELPLHPSRILQLIGQGEAA